MNWSEAPETRVVNTATHPEAMPNAIVKCLTLLASFASRRSLCALASFGCDGSKWSSEYNWFVGICVN